MQQHSSGYTVAFAGAICIVCSVLVSSAAVSLSERQEASGIAGLMDFSFNIGAGLSGGIVGAILDTRSWDLVFFALAGALLVTAVFMFITDARSDK